LFSSLSIFLSVALGYQFSKTDVLSAVPYFSPHFQDVLTPYQAFACGTISFSGVVFLLFFRFSLSSVCFRIRINSGAELATIAFPLFLPADLADLGGACVIEVHK